MAKNDEELKQIGQEAINTCNIASPVNTNRINSPSKLAKIKDVQSKENLHYH